ncbi:hypothetical protein [Sorangium cellulosum]|uniref:hypothetical protein n=1 Tax=Sorangium cellulosum TaxID=56 RepID=UPI0012DB6922|nr:hypothetical protein [Sorangium cellulosum]
MTTSVRRAAGAALGAFFCAATAGAVALAQTGGEPGAPRDDGALAARSYKVGVAAAREGRWPDAYAAYLEAWRLKRHFQIAANLARAELKLGKHRDAAEHIAFFLREAEGVSEPDRALGRQMLDEAKAHLATLKVVVSRAGATVLVDGVPVGTSPLGREVYVEPGERRLEARLQGEIPAQTSAALAPGASQEVELRFAERAAAGAVQPAAPRRSPAAPRRPPAAPDHGASGPSTALIAAGGAATVLAAGTAVVLRVFADRSARSGSDAAVPGADSCYSNGPPALHYTRCLVVDEHRTEAVSLRNASTGVFIAAGVLGAATVGYALYGSSRAGGGPAVTAVPVALAPGAGVSLRARW